MGQKYCERWNLARMTFTQVHQLAQRVGQEYWLLFLHILFPLKLGLMVQTIPAGVKSTNFIFNLVTKILNFTLGYTVSIGNHTVSSSIWNLFARVSFSKSWNCTSRFGKCNFSFLKNSQVQINFKLNVKNRATTY